MKLNEQAINICFRVRDVNFSWIFGHNYFKFKWSL